MKKIIGLFFIVLASFALFACKKDTNGDPQKLNYVYNGTFTAHKASLNYGAPQLSWVTLTVEDGEIKSFYIDEIQTTNGVWNSKTKKQLKEEYGMTVVPGTIQVEWYKQAAFLEEVLLEKGPEFVKWDGEGYPTNDGFVVKDENDVPVTGVTMVVDIYVELAMEAIANWKQGKYTALNWSLNYGAVQYTWVDMYVKDGQIIDFNIDELQSSEGVWNLKSKKVLKDEYGMIVASPIQKEWYEQAHAIEDFFLNQPISSILLDGEGYVHNVTGASMIADTYTKLALINVNYFKEPTTK